MTERRSIDIFNDLAEPVEGLLDACENLEVEVEDDYIGAYIRNADDPGKNIQFLGRMEDYRKGTVYFVIRTLDRDTGLRHPYFERHRASTLAAKAIYHFAQTYEINGVEFDWKRPYNDSDQSSNYTTYITERDRLKNDMPIDQARARAVFATWTAQHIALPHGFTELRDLREDIWSDDPPELPRGVEGTLWRDGWQD